MHRRRGRSAGPEGERGVSTPPSLPLDTPLPWTGCGSQRMLRPLSGPCILLATAPTTPPCFCRRQRSSSLQERGCSPLSDPKEVGSTRKYGRFTPFGVKIFSPYFRLPPIGKAPQSLRDSSPQGSGCREPSQSNPCGFASSPEGGSFISWRPTLPHHPKARPSGELARRQP